MRHWLEHAAVVVMRTLIGPWPMSWVRALGAMFGRALYVFDGRHRRVALENLRAAFPGRSEAERRAIALGVFAHIGRLTLEVLRLGSTSPTALDALVELEGEDRVREAYAKGKGVIFFSGHFGYWEMLHLSYGRRLAPMALVVRPFDNPRLDAMVERFRAMTGNTSIARQGVVRRVLRELGAGRGVAILIDQHLHGPDAIDVQFFGRVAKTTSAVAALALRTGAPVIPVFSLPLPGGRYRVIADHPVEPPSADTLDAVREFTQRCTDVLEMYVRRYPDMWLWVHRRWRDGGADGASEAGGAGRAGEAGGVDEAGGLDEGDVTGGPA